MIGPPRTLALTLIGAAICAPAAALASSAQEPEQTTADDTPTPLVLAGNPDLEVRLSGRVHRMLQVVDDGRDTDAFHTDRGHKQETGRHIYVDSTYRVAREQKLPYENDYSCWLRPFSRREDSSTQGAAKENET